MPAVICPYCSRPAVRTSSVEVYGVDYGMIYLCRPCHAYVGCHKRSGKPLGTLANAELREYRKAAHTAFDPLWNAVGGKFFGYRRDAYEWLAVRMELPVEKCHIGMFDVRQCKQVIEECLRIQGGKIPSS